MVVEMDELAKADRIPRAEVIREAVEQYLKARARKSRYNRTLTGGVSRG
jgi:metal-responsive CopG/Arc/MetJ family transcriptional regulator